MIRTWLRNVAPVRSDLKGDAIAAVPGSIASVPDGMAAAVLVGVNPVHGLYASVLGRLVGGLTTSTRTMVITTTSAAALAAGSALDGVDAADRPAALFLLTLIAGIVLVAAGIGRLGRYTRFVSHSVMIGFLSGVALNIAFGQLGDLTGVTPEGSVAAGKALYVVLHPGQIDVATLLTGLGAIALLVVLSRTRFKVFSAVIALVVPTAIVLAFGIDAVALVEDGGAIPRGIPLPAMPHLSMLSFDLLVGAGAVAAIVLVQGAGVSESVPNVGAPAASSNGDLVAQGVGNIASGIFQGQPVGGSVGMTALNASAGARSRWASIFSALLLLAILAALSGVVGKVAMTTLGAVLIYAAVTSLRPHEVRSILRTGATSRIALLTTFIATLLLPVAAAVGIGVALSLLLQLNQDAMDLSVVELAPTEDGTGFMERPAPARLRAHEVVVLDVYGSLLYAGARTLKSQLPDPTGVQNPAVVLRLRGRTSLGTTFFTTVSDYARQVAAEGGRVYLSGVDPALVRRAERSRTVTVSGPIALEEATPLIGESTHRAVEDAHVWLVHHTNGAE